MMKLSVRLVRNFSIFCGLILVVVSVFIPLARAQSVSIETFYQAALDALGGDTVRGIVIEGEGWDACLGQAWSINEGWARWELKNYRRKIDYESGSSSHITMRMGEMDPGKAGGCGAQPGGSARQQEGFIGPASPWLEQLLIWMTPHGLLSLFDTDAVTLRQTGAGWRVELRPVRDGIEYTMIARFNMEYELENVTTWVDNSIFGDMEVSVEFGNYRSFDEMHYPERLTMRQGGYVTLLLNIGNVASNDELLRESVARTLTQDSAVTPPSFEEIGPGIFAFYGAYQSVAVEFRDFAVVIDGLQSDARVKELISQVGEAIPDKPIRYVVSTHSHFDHASGLRQFVEQGAVILMHNINVDFFEKALETPRTLREEDTEFSATESAKFPIEIQGIEGRYAISDGFGQIVELYTLGPSAHAKDMVIAYLPSIKAIVEADLYQPWINPVFAGETDGPHPYLRYLSEELERTGIDYEQFIPIHVPPNPPAMSREALDDALSR